MKKKLLITVITLFALIPQTKAQIDTTRRSSVIIFGDNPAGASTYGAYAVKFGLFDMLSGVYGLFYEKEMSDIFAVQAGAGLTGRNFMQGLAIDGEDAYDDGNQHYVYKHRDAKMGYFVSVQPKFYYAEYGYDGPYLGLNFAYRHHSFEAQRVDWAKTTQSYGYNSDLVYSTGKGFEEYENQTILNLIWGYQWVDTKTVVDTNFGVGFRNTAGKRRSVTSGYSDINGNYVAGTDFLESVKSQKLYVEWGLKVGIQWVKN